MSNNFRTARGYEQERINEKMLTPSMEDYLEMIYRNNLEQPYIRINRLAQLLNVKAPSSSKMVQKLGELGFVNYERYGIVTLTDKGKRKGEILYKRHKVIEKFLSFIGCEEDALIQTELIEHSINANTVEKMELLYNFINDNKDILERYIEHKQSKTEWMK